MDMFLRPVSSISIHKKYSDNSDDDLMTKNHYIYFDNICSELTLSFFNFCFYFENRENWGERVENILVLAENIRS